MLQTTRSKPLSEEERSALAKKLDDDLDRFMDEMAAKRKDENVERKPFDFDEFCREIDQHPIFMKDLKPKENGEFSEHIQALQALKYDDEDEEDKQFSAEKHKNEGNKHFKLKKYRWAIDCYTSGMKVQCLDRRLNGQLYLNRATCHKYIGNLRSAIKDCASGRRFDPTNLKTSVRGAECLLALGYASDALRWLDSSEKLFKESTKDIETVEETENGNEKQLQLIAELRSQATKKKEQEERDKRKERAESLKDEAEKRKLLTSLTERGVNLSPRVPFTRPDLFEWSLLEVNMPQLKDHQRVSFNEAGNLQWPLLLQYPEVGQTDVLTECDETTMVGTLLASVLEEPAEWDSEHSYNMNNVSFFVSDEFDEFVMEVYPWTDFRTMFSYPGYQIRQGLPVLMVFTREKVEKTFKSIGENKYAVV